MRTTVMEIALDVSSMATDDGSCCIIEVMGRAAGWIAAGTVLANAQPHDAPHIILVAGNPFRRRSFLAKVKETVAANEILRRGRGRRFEECRRGGNRRG